ncbi:ankyrin repeat domain protein [Nitzschia inconspicua]|uniref:Ankyrin repeat domain protein n=1 Tax=Nitzschia inconspicua TaxID=303405 RepID=A0A9K3PID9_9STRA|nr:ankyrin repeat domain protein [Nitzschia inconspicua]
MERPPRSPTSPSQRLAVESSRSPVQRPVPETSTDSPNRRSSRKLRKETNDNDSQNKRPKDKSRDKQKNKTDDSNEKKKKISVKSERSGKSKRDNRVNPGSSTTVALDDSEEGWAQGILPDQQPASPISSKKSGRRTPSTRSSRMNSRSPSPRPFPISNDQSPSPRQSRISNDTSRSPRPSRISNIRSPSPRPSQNSDRSRSPAPSNLHRRNTSPSPSRRNNANFNASSLSLDDGESDVGGESEDDWRGEFADSVGPQTGIPYILDNGLPSVPVLAKGENAKFHDCIKNHNWDKLEKLLRNFDANYYKKKRLQVRERREQELLRMQQAEEEAKAADEKAAAEAKELGSEGENTKTTPPPSRRFFPPFSRKSPGNQNKQHRPQNETSGSNGGLASKLLPKSLAARLIIDPEEVLSPLLMVDEMERTPLHLACIHKAPETVLLDLLAAERKAAMVKDENGRVPLHCAVEIWQFDHVIEKIIRAFPHALKTKDESGKTPIGLAVTLALERQQKESNEDPERPFLWIHPTCKEEESWQYQQEKIWGKVNLLLKGLMKRNKVVIPSEHSLILEALIGGANPNTINRFVSTADRYLVSDDELAGTAIGLCVERHYPLDTIEYVVDNCREKTTIITDAITKALRAHYRLGCHAIREGMTPFGKQIIEWSKSSHPLREDNPLLERSPKIESLEKGKPGITKKMSRRFFGADVDNGENGVANDIAKAEGNPSGEDEKHKVDQWHGMDESCKQWWQILNYLIFYCAYGRGYKESLKPKSHHLLHAALSIPVSPPSLIQLLLIVYPEATKEPCPLYGALPMHIACTRWRYDIIRNDGDSSLDRVLKLMLKSDPDIVHHRHKGRLPIHLALSVGQTWSFVKTFVAMDKKCVGMRDPQSRFFPFQMAALPMTSKNVQLLMRSQFTPTEWRIMSTGEKKLEYRKVEIDQDRKQVGTIFELLRRHPDALVGKPLYRGDGPPSTALRVTGKVSMTYLSYVYGRNSQGEYRLRADNVRILRDAIVRADIPLDMENWWENMKESIWEEYHGDIPRNDQHLLHAALYNPESPPLLIELLLVIFPFSVSSAVAGTATYPLHIAAATTAYHRHSFELPYGMDNLHLVLSADKRIARRRSNGRLPLHIALARGKSWKEVRPLVMADPSSLMSEDPQTGLLPFQLIASFNVTSKENAMRFSTFVERQTRNIDMNRLSAKDKALALNRIRKVQELSQLTCIFELLRHRPSAMHRIPPGYAISEAGSVFSSSSYTLGSRGSDSHTGGAAARVGEFLSDSSQVNNRSSSIRGLFSPIPLSSRSMVPTYKDDESTKSLVSPSEAFSRQSVVANSLSGATVHSNCSLSSKDGSDVFGGYTKHTYDDDSASSIVGASFHSIDASTHSSPGLLKRGNYRRGKRPPRMPPKVPDLDKEG